MLDFNSLNASIKPLDNEIIDESHKRWDFVAKPIGSLGEFEPLVTKISGILGELYPSISKRCVVVSCADNGVTKHGVAMTPSSVTVTMTDFISQSRSAVGVMAQYARTDVITVDCGMFTRLHNDNIIDCHVKDGTNDITTGPAMSVNDATYLIQSGIDLVGKLKANGYSLIATGEMGIGNTTTSSAIISVLLNQDPAITTGRGVGLSDEALHNKIDVIRTAIDFNKPNCNDAFDVLCKVGGFDIAHMTGLFIGGAIHQVPVIIDGVISSAAALIASRLCPQVNNYMLPSHLSNEHAALLVANALNLKPIIHAEMRLGEGTGAVALIPLLDMAISVQKDLFTYADLGMS